MSIDHHPPPWLAHISKDGQRRQAVREHLLGTASLAGEFAQPFGGQEQARLAGLLHDVGKCSDGSQRRLQGGKRVDHSTAGAKIAFSQRQLEVAFAVAGHHGGLPDGGAKTDPSSASTLLGRLKREVELCSQWEEEVALPRSVSRAPAGRDGFSAAFYTRMLYSCLVDADYLDTEAFLDGAKPRGSDITPSQLLTRLEHYVVPWWNARTPLNEKRCSILRQCFSAGQQGEPGLYTLTVPTGGGKTVSSLAFALAHAAAKHRSRVIYVIPYTSIIDQTAEVFRNILGEEAVVEHHSGADFTLPEDEPDPTLYRKALAAENWDAPVIVTTAVQFFESLYSNRSSRCRKLHNIANSVVIFDEAQTLPIPYLRPCVAAIGQLVRFYNVTAVLCTATQPALQPLFDQLSPGLRLREICPDTTGLYRFFCRTTLVQAGELTEEALLSHLNAAEQCLCVVNRRATAQRLFEQLEPESRFCLTTLLCPAHRKQLLKEIRRRLAEGLPCRVVATSLIEAGVDVDFPAVWREETGLDSILHTAGRCNREGKRPIPDSIVTVFRLEGTSPHSSIRHNVDASRSVLARFPDPAVPEAIEGYFSFLRELKGDQAQDVKDVIGAFRQGIQGNQFPFSSVAEKFHLIDSPTVTVYLPVSEGQALVERLRPGAHSRSLYRKLGQYGVNVYQDHLKKLLAAGAVQPVGDGSYYLTDTSLYSSETGLALDVETGNPLMI